jgi:acyl-coenzyme A thioesterase PaaI-like protein
MATAVITASRAQGLRVVAHSIEMKISFLRPAQLGSELWCTGLVVRSGQRVSFAEFDIRDTARDLLVAKGSSSFLLAARDRAVRGEVE